MSELAGRATAAEKAQELGLELDEDGAARVTEQVKRLEHRGYQYEAADGSFALLVRRETGAFEPLFTLESWRVIVEQRRDGAVETEATIKIWVDGERYVRTAEGNGPVNALDAALRAAIAEIHPHLAAIELVNYKVRILDERHGTAAVTRVLIDSSDGHEVWGSIGVHENVIAASWEALVESLAYAEQPAAGAAPRARPGPAGAGAVSGVRQEEVPLARPVLGEAEEQAVLDVLRSGQLSLGPRVPAFEEAFAARLGVAHASAVSSGTAGLHLALRAVGVGEGDEVVTSPFSFVASANSVLFERARPVFADIDPVTLNLDPAAAAAAVTDRTTALLPVHIFGYPADLPALERLGLPLVEDACEALGAVHADGVAVGARGHPAVFGFYANKQLTTGEGGMVTTARRGGQGARRQRAQPGPRPGHGLARPRPPRLQLPPQRPARRASAWPSSTASTRCSRPARGVAAAYREALAGLERERGSGCPCPDAGGDRRGLVRLRRAGPARPRPRRGRSRALRARGVQCKPYLPAIHLMSFYRERFGHRPGEFPVCEDVAARSVALPFFPGLAEDQVARVAEALAGALDAPA